MNTQGHLVSVAFGILALFVAASFEARAAAPETAKLKTISLGFVSKRTQAEVEPQFRELSTTSPASCLWKEKW